MATNKTGSEVKINLEKPVLQDFDLKNSEEFFETEPENENGGPVKKLTGKERKEEVNTVNCSDEDFSRKTDDTDSEASSTSVTMYPLNPKQTKTSLARANCARGRVQGAQERQNSSEEEERRKRSKIAPPTPPPHLTGGQGELNASTIAKRLKLRRQMSDKQPVTNENRKTEDSGQSSGKTSSEITSTDAGSQNESEAVPATVNDRSLFPDLISQGDEAERMKKQIQEISWWWDNYASKSEQQYPDHLNKSTASAPAAVGETSLGGKFFDNEHGLDTSLPTNLGEDPVLNEEVEDWWARSFLPPAVTPTPLLMLMKHSPSRESFQRSTPLPLEGRRRIPSFWKNLSTIPQENSEESDSEDGNQEKASTARNGTAQGNNHPNQAGDLPTSSTLQQHNLNGDIQPDLDYVQPPTMIKTSTRECLTFAKDHIVHFIPANLDLSTPNNRLLLD
ncbi:hypothetical protein QAD02_007265 [Eretmocerus hayati]|uniref:Uncharacterized protein n=1 Tax=Eretmocerus hayati TaxID=131215 RepID=A0ACC2N376_9HYME|nr:hypothetical protein QAD02_007265 [Eretmocerus hayati]